MTIGEIVDAVQGEVMCGEDRMFEVVEYAFASDLMSDVLTIKTDNFLLVTGLANVQSIRTSMFKTSGILYSAGLKPVY